MQKNLPYKSQYWIENRIRLFVWFSNTVSMYISDMKIIFWVGNFGLE